MSFLSVLAFVYNFKLLDICCRFSFSKCVKRLRTTVFRSLYSSLRNLNALSSYVGNMSSPINLMRETNNLTINEKNEQLLLVFNLKTIFFGIAWSNSINVLLPTCKWSKYSYEKVYDMIDRFRFAFHGIFRLSHHKLIQYRPKYIDSLPP